MRIPQAILLTATHAIALVAGVGLGVYFLPIWSAPPPPTSAQISEATKGARYHGEFRRDLKGSDAFHWGEGKVSISPRAVSLQGRVAPGPAYKLYLVPEFVETEEDFKRIKPKSAVMGDIKTFENFLVPLPAGTVLEEYKAVVVWCEAFSQFITAARYR